ncbi:MAG TPA: lipid A biosynthesis acyltransferase, partial [Candidatus Angelobacter sp.]|nr:lipid A biosynthesis acyltransferase [Candidatus Angelobacter sp.]
MSTLRHKLEYFPVWLLATGIGALPRPLARSFCQGIGMFMYAAHGRLRKVGLRNLDLAFPEKSRKEKLRILRELFKGLGRQLAEFALFPRYTKENAAQVAIYDGFQNFAEAR